ncbi:MAG TPA: hypothetical protein VFO04_05035 [Nitrospira sp.]|nr:hypothetical protein [Nitrospira sp.]
MTRPITPTIVLMLLLTAGALTYPTATLAAEPEIKEGTLHLVSGTLLKLDLLNGRGLLKTDLGRPIYFEVPKAYLFENVIVGARIALRLDEEGRAVRVMDTAIADVVITPDQPLAATAPEDQ